jgi:hypothetical protein
VLFAELGPVSVGDSRSHPDKSAALPVTDWEQLDRLKAGGDAGQLPVLDLLAKRYWTPIFTFLVSQAVVSTRPKTWLKIFSRLLWTPGCSPKPISSGGGSVRSCWGIQGGGTNF